MQEHVNLVDLEKSFLNLLFETDSYSNEYVLAKIGVDTAENKPLKVHFIIKPRDLIFTLPPRPRPPGAWLPRAPERAQAVR